MMRIDLKLTDKEIAELHKSWQVILQESAGLGKLFYAKLFEESPELRLLFQSNLDEQAEKFMTTMTYILTRLYNRQTLIGDIQHLAKRHHGYGAQPEHYVAVGRALLSTLEQGLGDHWNKELAYVWKSTYERLSEAMIRSATPSVSKTNAA